MVRPEAAAVSAIPSASDIPAEQRYQLAAETIGAAEIKAAKTVLDSGFMTMAGRVRAFEEEFAGWVGARHAVIGELRFVSQPPARGRPAPVNDRARTLAPGDEVLVPGLSWPTTVWPLAQLGLVPVFVDIDPATLAIDLGSAAAAVGPRTKAMFLIHPLGRAVEMPGYLEFCSRYDLTLIEDACESLGAWSDGHHVGTFGLGGSFSFYFSHHLSTIEGGMVITGDDGLADDLRSLRAHGWIRDRSDRETWVTDHPDLDPRFLFATMGYNVRPTEIQGAIGIVQLERLEEMLAAREALARNVQEWLSDAPWLELIGSETLASTTGPRADRAHSWMTLPLRVRPDAPMTRNEVEVHLETHGVETRALIAGNLARHPAVAQIRHRVAGSMTECDSLLRNGLMIGCHPVLPDERRNTLQRALLSLSHAAG